LERHLSGLRFRYRDIARAHVEIGQPMSEPPPTAPYFRWAITPTYLAHLFKATLKQHHKSWGAVVHGMLPEDGVVFDIGAHAGQYAKLLSRLVPRGQVFAFEPGSYARSILRVALYVNRCRNVTIVPLALGEREGTAMLTLPVKRRGAYGFGLAHLGQDARWREVRRDIVALTTIDRFAQLVELDRLDFIKADIEGWEMHAVRGGLDTIRRFRPVIMLEMTEALTRAGDDLASAYRTLAELGYRPAMLAADGRLQPVERPCEGDIWWLPEGRARRGEREGPVAPATGG
jgi:FkbM family methyltransferase